MLKKFKEFFKTKKKFDFKKTLISMRKSHISYPALSIVMAVVLVSTLSATAKNHVPMIGKGGSLLTVEDSDARSIKPLSEIKNDGNFSNVSEYNVANAKGTVIYLPQIHKEPTSNINDKKNDKAAGIQMKIYGTLDTLNDDYSVRYVMDETDLYGKMPDAKVGKMKAGFKDIDEFRTSLDTTIDHYLKDGGDPQVASKLRSDSEKTIAKYERNLYLTGGAAVLAAKEDDAVVYGSQNAATLQESKDKLQKIVFLEGRIKQLKPAQSAGNPLLRSRTLATDDLAAVGGSNINSILGKLSGGNSGVSFAPIESFAKKNGDQELTDQVSELKKDANELSTKKSFESSPKFSDQKQPANPYSNVKDLKYLEKEHKAAYDDFLKVAKDKRSQEAADNVVAMMDQNNTDAGVLVYGAQHQDQIVAALNSKSYNVIVIDETK